MAWSIYAVTPGHHPLRALDYQTMQNMLKDSKILELNLRIFDFFNF